MFTFPENARDGFFLLPEELVGKPDSPEGFVPSLWPRLPQSAQAVLVVLASHVNQKNFAFPSEERLAGLCGLTRKTVRRGLRELQDNGVIEIAHYTTRKGRRANKYKWLLRRNGENMMRLYHLMVDQGVWRKFSRSAKSLYLAFRFFGRARPDLDPEFDQDEHNYGAYLSTDVEDGPGEEWLEYLQNRNVDFCNAEPGVLCDYAGISRRIFSSALEYLKEVAAVTVYDEEYWKVSIRPPMYWKSDFLNREVREAGGIK